MVQLVLVYVVAYSALRTVGSSASGSTGHLHVVAILSSSVSLTMLLAVVQDTDRDRMAMQLYYAISLFMF